MSHRLLAACALLLLACPSKPTPTPVAAPAPKAAPPVPDDDCTLATALKPGVPGSPGHLITSDINPNGASELAALMRTMVADWRAVKATLEADGGAPHAKYLPVHRKLRCSWPTDAKDRDATFDGLAVSYLAAVKAFDAAPSKQTYGAVIAGCAACHEVTCGGPLELIDGLKLP